MNSERIEHMVACLIQDVSVLAENVKTEAVVAIREAKQTPEQLREQRRFEAAKAAMQGLLSDASGDGQLKNAGDLGIANYTFKNHYQIIVADSAVRYADALLAALDRPAAREAANE